MNRLKNQIAVLLTAAVLSGCASGTSGGAIKSDRGTSNAFTSLYAGEPDVVFATEFPVASAEDAIARADRALANDDLDLALYLYVRGYDLERENVYALAQIGSIHESRQNDRLASLAFTNVLQIEPGHAQALQSLGLVYLRAKRFEEARGLLEQAIIANPGLWRAHNGLGFIADLQGDHDAAIAAYNAALAIEPDDAALVNNRGYSNYLAGRYEEATADFRFAEAQGVERASLNLGLVMARQGKYADAVRMMAKSIKPELAYNDVGYIAMRQGDATLAERYFRKAISLAPRYFEAAQRNLAELQAERLAAEPGVQYLDQDAS